jgi:hypothetical protein
MNLHPAELSCRISVHDGHDKYSLPEWAASLIWLGAWCRSSRLVDKRLIVFVVLPTRELAAAFASLGCLVAGAKNFEDTLSWPTFKKLPRGRGVFWSRENGTVRYRGNIVGFEEIGGAEFIAVEITKAPKRSAVGSSLKISKEYFDDYRFTEEKPPAVPRVTTLDAAERSIGGLVENLNPKWIWADGAEGLLITGVTTFENAIFGLSLSIGEKNPIAMSDLLCSGRNKDQSHAKLRIDHPKGVLAGRFPIVILDGAKAFMVHEHLAHASNMLVILDRSEYQDEIHNTVLALRSISFDAQATDDINLIPQKFMTGIELAAFWIDEK